jgi:hypothetical protein
VADTRIRLLGIRHHGPGSARAVRRVLDDDPPDVVLVEGPADAAPVLALAAHADMQPPVALLAYVADRPERAVFSPFASFSPEWVALRWALDADVAVRFVDLAARHTLASPSGDDAQQLRLGVDVAHRPVDPLAELAAAAGHDDAERWWEDVVEHRGAAHDLAQAPFLAIAEAMTALREHLEPGGEPADPLEQRREAQMRAAIRTAVADGHRDVVVVCGAWHVPALADALVPARARRDAALLRGMPKVKAVVTWVPWSHRRLAAATGYGAGVVAPGWYDHLHRHPGEGAVARWFADAAQVLRSADHAASAADVVEATRLAHALAALRDRPLAGLTEVDDAARAVFGQGGDAPMRLLSSALVVGDRLGSVPDSTPMVPLARSLAAEQKRCRLKPEGATRTLELDLRQPLHLERSRLLHRLTLLDVGWGREVEGRRSAGTFRETWELRWEPEFELRIIEASALGTTVVTACAAAAAQRADGALSLGELTLLLERCLLAGLDDAVPHLLRLVDERAAVSSDVARLIEAVPPLARTVRYGDARATDADAVQAVIGGIVHRVTAGLAPACTALGDDESAVLAGLVRDLRSSLSLLGDDVHLAALHRALDEVAERDRVHGLLQGVAVRLLADAGVIDATDTEVRVSRRLSPAVAPLDAAAFVEGFLGGAGAVLVHDPVLLGVVDRWLAALASDAFTQTLPLLRRTFGAFEVAERRAIGERVRSGAAPLTHRVEHRLDPDRVAAALQTVASLLGVRS